MGHQGPLYVLSSFSFNSVLIDPSCKFEEMSSIGSLVPREVVDRWEGFLFVVVSFFFLLLFLYAAIISKLLPPSNNAFLSAIQNDWYYCLLVPLTLPILYVAIYFHWLSMKLFKHA
ncbi:unnamed protein product [Citrullus colocynthis]|uniref:Phosphatidylinositol N-acetylglucosaminyltransferase subunit Y n=1 Tax=Citrullus colocynthis TaxID=252529 RepID=A0ABP0Y672_9ROSI